MLPPSLVSIYHQYKEDTNAVAAWLASTAKSRGYAPKAASSSSTTTGPPSSKRLKGKARKDAKAALQQAHVSSTNSSGPEYVIAINDFVPLAKFLAGCNKPAVSVPLSFTSTLNRVISTRASFSKKLAILRDGIDASSDSNHAYFVRVLEEVREVLKPRVPPATRDPPMAASSAGSSAGSSKGSSAAPLGEVGGKFAGLSVEDPSEAFLNAPDIERPTPAENDKATYKAEPQQDLTEIIFAYNLLLNDLNKIRNRITWIWAEHKGKVIDLITAAIATNTACDLARQLTEEMEPMFKPHGGLVEIAKKFYYYKCLDLGFRGPYPSQDRPELIYETYGLADETYVIPIVMLEKLEQIVLLGDTVVLRNRQFDTYDQSAEWTSIPNSEKYRNDEMVMWEMFCEITLMIPNCPGLLVDDEFVRGVRKLQQTREIPMSLVFAAQVLLDIHHDFRDGVFSLHKDCMRQLDHMEKDLSLHLDFIVDGYFKGFAYSEHEALSEYSEEIKFVQSDPIHRLKVEYTKARDMPCPLSNLTILKYSPVISGLFLFRMRRQIYDTSLRLANASRAILYPMHLYNALRQEELLSSQEVPSGCWQDMELICKLLGVENIFVGDRPKKTKDYMKNLLLQTGMTVATLSKSGIHSTASNRRKSKKGARLIKLDSAPVMDMFVDRYVRKQEQFEWTSQAVESIISRSYHFQDLRRDSKQNRAAKATGPQMTPEKLIESLVWALHTETITLAFPYLSMQRSTWDMLRAVRHTCGKLVLQLGGANYVKDDSQLQGIVPMILLHHMDGDDRLFVKAGEAVKEELRKGKGHKAVRHLYDMGYVVTSASGDQHAYNPQTDTMNLDVDSLGTPL